MAGSSGAHTETHTHTSPTNLLRFIDILSFLDVSVLDALQILLERRFRSVLNGQ
jgi:hypothetical protein